jgi:glycosyltransferase involved in cell wall biosynthesis
MIFFDVTKMGAARHQSGLMRLSARLREELGAAARPVRWDLRRRAWLDPERRQPVAFAAADWLLTAELFSEPERPGFWEFLGRRPCRLAAVFCDAIPLQHPHITWPQSVARHPEYLKMLAAFDRVWAISAASRDALAGFWRWQQAEPRAAVDVLALGADLDRTPRATTVAPAAAPPRLLCVGILEPRKNQTFLLDVGETLWREGVDFELHVVGRANPHFGRPMARRLAARAKTEPRLRFHAAAPDARLSALYATARATAVPTLAEGYGLPVLESLWHGRPCVCSDLPVLREIAGGGCVPVPPNDAAAWTAALRTVLTDDAEWRRLAAGAVARALPTWTGTAQTILDGLK